MQSSGPSALPDPKFTTFLYNSDHDRAFGGARTKPMSPWGSDHNVFFVVVVVLAAGLRAVLPRCLPGLSWTHNIFSGAGVGWDYAFEDFFLATHAGERAEVFTSLPFR